MTALWLAPVLLGVLALIWWRIQRAWINCMQQPEDADALARPGGCGAACTCTEATPEDRVQRMEEGFGP